ncbi:MAG: hypothetical protein H6704_07885 [Myxococcales bacterium]|nr:hypothetical protein [Myxococcales bacterium]
MWVPVDPDEQPAPVRGAAGPSDSVEVAAADDDDGTVSGQSFALESHLQRFLWDNWDQSELAHDWEVYTEPGDDERGYEYPCDVGRIDILARSHDGERWLVVELKRGRTARLRAALDVLLDEGRPIDARVDHTVERISGMGTAIVPAGCTWRGTTGTGCGTRRPRAAFCSPPHLTAPRAAASVAPRRIPHAPALTTRVPRPRGGWPAGGAAGRTGPAG